MATAPREEVFMSKQLDYESGAEGGSRTRTSFRTTDFKSSEASFCVCWRVSISTEPPPSNLKVNALCGSLYRGRPTRDKLQFVRTLTMLHHRRDRGRRNFAAKPSKPPPSNSIDIGSGV